MREFRMRLLLILGLSLGWSIAWGQPSISRADLAVRLVEVEACWEAHRGSLDARLRAMRPLSEGLTAFFSGRFDTLARHLTLTCAALSADLPPTLEMLYAGALGIRLPRLVDKDALAKGVTPLRLQLFSFYEVEKPPCPVAATLARSPVKQSATDW
jgi:hypothetical protein